MSFDGTDPSSKLIQIDNAFEEVCFMLEQNNVISPKSLSIYEFHKKVDIIKKHKQKNKKPKP